MKQKILVLGNANMEITMNAERIPDAGESTVDAGGITVNPGGRGSNCAIAMARLNAKAVLCAKVGDDGYGKRLARLYTECDMDLSYMQIDRNLRTGVDVTINEGDAKARKIYFIGANSNISAEIMKEAFSCEPEAVLVSTELSPEAVENAARDADFMAATLVLNASPANKDIRLSKISPVEIFVAGAEDIYSYTGILPVGSESCLRAALELQKMIDARYYVIHIGDKGSFVYDGKYYHMISPYAVKAVDETGAGDVFVGALTVEYTRNGKDIIAACKYANAAGALSVLKAGTTPSMPFHADVMQFISKYSF